MPASVIGKAQLYYPRLAEDAFNLYQDGANMDCQDTKEGCFYGICVNECVGPPPPPPPVARHSSRSHSTMTQAYASSVPFKLPHAPPTANRLPTRVVLLAAFP